MNIKYINYTDLIVIGASILSLLVFSVNVVFGSVIPLYFNGIIILGVFIYCVIRNDPANMLRRGLEFVRSHKAWGNNVLIACGAGVSRASAFAVAVLKEEESLSLLEALREVHARHPEIMPHPELWKSLCSYYGENLTLIQMLDVLKP